MKIAVLIGSEEAAAGQITVKDLILGAEMAKAIETNEEWKSSRPAQQTVVREHAVKAIKEMLAD
jgi:histidyl-tRNA synthetase